MVRKRKEKGKKMGRLERGRRRRGRGVVKKERKEGRGDW